MTKSNLKLELAKDPELIRFTHSCNGEQWKFNLSIEQYQEREWKLGVESLLGKRNEQLKTGIYHYVLRDHSIETGGSGEAEKYGNIVSSVETFNRIGWSVKNGQVEEVMTACIGGVFTRPQFRKQGYAGEMIKALNKHLDEQLGDKSFTTLYSEVGEYYSRFGYRSFGVPLHYIDVGSNTTSDTPGSLKYLGYNSFDKLAAHEENVYLQQLKLRSGSDEFRDKTIFSMKPDEKIFKWFFDRDIFISNVVHPSHKVENYGVQLDSTNSYIVWYHDWNEEKLMILNIFNENDDLDDLSVLLKAALNEASKYGLKKIVLWDSLFDTMSGNSSYHKNALELIEKFSNVEMFKENSSLSALRAHNQQLNDSKDDLIVWENNRKWCWF